MQSSEMKLKIFFFFFPESVLCSLQHRRELLLELFNRFDFFFFLIKAFLELAVSESFGFFFLASRETSPLFQMRIRAKRPLMSSTLSQPEGWIHVFLYGWVLPCSSFCGRSSSWLFDWPFIFLLRRPRQVPSAVDTETHRPCLGAYSWRCDCLLEDSPASPLRRRTQDKLRMTSGADTGYQTVFVHLRLVYTLRTIATRF